MSTPEDEEDAEIKRVAKLRSALRKKQNQNTKKIAKKLIAENWADNVSQNIEQFFRHHQSEKKDNLVRPNLDGKKKNNEY